MLFAERKRLAEITEREARGESVWTEEVELPARVKLAKAWKVAREQTGNFDDFIVNELTTDLGINGPSTDPNILTNMALREDMLFTYLEVVYLAVVEYSLLPEAYLAFESSVNRVLNAHRVKYRMVEGQIIPLEAEELHVAVVEPVLRLLHGRPELEKAHVSYLKALKEISNEDGPDAITDAATALQETLNALGCEGNALGDLIKSAKKKGLLAPHDLTLTAGIEKFMHWVSADRSETGDAHQTSPATLADAWLMVHIVGALIIRLADPSKRA